MSVNSVPMTECAKPDSNPWNYILIVCAGILVFSPCLFNFFVSDDFIWLDRGVNLSLRSLFQENETASYNIFRPLIPPLFFGLHRIFGLCAWGYHLTSIALHILNGLLFFSILLQFSLRRDLALVSSLVFVTHFAHEETVLWISSNCVLACWFLLLASVLAFLRWLTHGGIWPYLVSLSLAAIALLAREDALVLPVILPVILGLYVLLRQPGTAGGFDRTWKLGRLLSMLPFFVSVLLYLYLRGISLPHLSAQSLVSLSPANVVRNFAYFSANVSLPLRPIYDLIGYHHSRAINSAVSGITAAPPMLVSVASLLAVVGLVLVLGTWMVGKRSKGFKLSVAAFLAALFPLLFFRGCGLRFTYLPLLGFSPMAAVVLLWLVKKTTDRISLFQNKCLSVSIIIVVCFNFLVLLERHPWWMRASRTCEETIAAAWAEVSSLPDRSTVCLQGLPARLHGAYIFNAGFVEAMHLFHPESRSRMTLLTDRDFRVNEGENPDSCYLFEYEEGRFRRLF